jgi:hypothetical protein
MKIFTRFAALNPFFFYVNTKSDADFPAGIFFYSAWSHPLSPLRPQKLQVCQHFAAAKKIFVIFFNTEISGFSGVFFRRRAEHTKILRLTAILLRGVRQAKFSFAYFSFSKEK